MRAYGPPLAAGALSVSFVTSGLLVRGAVRKDPAPLDRVETRQLGRARRCLLALVQHAVVQDALESLYEWSSDTRLQRECHHNGVIALSCA